MSLKYDTIEQASMRLQGSVITYKDKAIYIREVYTNKDGPWLKYQTYPVRGKPKEYFDVDASDPDLNFRIFRLGYLNSTAFKTAQYVTRASRRQQTQGLSRNNLNMASDEDFWGQGFEDMLFDKYPTPKSAEEMIRDGWATVGISRDFAIGRDTDFSSVRKLHYRGQACGIAIGPDAFLLSESFSFLKEVVEEANIPFRMV